MWTDKTLESLIPIAAAYLGSERRVSTQLTLGAWCPDREVDLQEWRSWSVGERAYFILFNYALYRGNTEALYRICPKAKADAIIAEIAADRKARHYSLTREASWEIAVSRMTAAKERQAQDKTITPRQRGWTREDVVAEYYDETGEPRLGPPKRTLDPIMPEYDQTPSPVRKVSVEEYQRTKRNPVYGGVKPEFAKESEHFAKELPDSADKIYERFDQEEQWGTS